jgi:hypothetical protein
MKNLNPIYLQEQMRVYGNVDTEIDLTDRTGTVAGGVLGGVAGNFISKNLLRDISDIKKLIFNSKDAKECVEVLKGYVDGGITPIAKIVNSCIHICNRRPEQYKSRCLSLLNNYNAIGRLIGTAGGVALGSLAGLALYD